jgi:hypothetical protein
MRVIREKTVHRAICPPSAAFEGGAHAFQCARDQEEDVRKQKRPGTYAALNAVDADDPTVLGRSGPGEDRVRF